MLAGGGGRVSPVAVVSSSASKWLHSSRTAKLARRSNRTRDPCDAVDRLSPKPPPGARNLLYLLIDDYRNEMKSAYGQTHMITPHLDRLAASSLTFESAYCQYALCAPSRASFLSGRRPETVGIYDMTVRHADQTRKPPHSSS